MPLSRRVDKRAESASLPEFRTLAKSSDFRRVLDVGARRRIGGITLVSSPGQPGPPRLGLVVSRRCGSAVTRNRIKRRLRSVAAEMDLQPGTDYVIIATTRVAEAPFQSLRQWLRDAVAGVERG